MADGASQSLSPSEAISLGMKLFNELMVGQPLGRVLLEGLRLDEESGCWVVTVGFDSERVKSAKLSEIDKALGGAIGNLMRKPEVEILREFRDIYLSYQDGAFIKLEHA